MQSPIVLSLGGSLVVPKEVDVAFLKRFKSFILKLSKKRKVLISVGGGATARKYLAASRAVPETSKSSKDDDLLGIQATRLNAQFVRNILGNKAHQEIITNPKKKVVTKKNIILAGGYKPGASSDHVAVLLAKTYKAKEIVNLSNTDYIYTADPTKVKTARRCMNISWSELQNIVGKKWTSSGHFPFDPIATREARKSNLTLYAIHGKRLTEVIKALEHKPFKGSTVKGR